MEDPDLTQDDQSRNYDINGARSTVHSLKRTSVRDTQAEQKGPQIHSNVTQIMSQLILLGIGMG